MTDSTSRADCAIGRRWLTTWLALAVTVAVAACGGGGGGSSLPPASSVGFLQVTVTDAFGAAVPDATVSGTLGGSTQTATTNPAGIAVIGFNEPNGTASLTVTRASFRERTATADVVRGQRRDVTITLDRTTAPAGGSLTTRSGFAPDVGMSQQTLTFEIEVVAVDGDGQPLHGLDASSFVLLPCAPDAATVDRADCVRGTSLAHDVAYTPVPATPLQLEVVAGGTPQPYAAALLLDQSGSIAQSDPTGARLYSAKVFLSGLGSGDAARIAAFAGGSDARIPTPPLATFGPFRGAAGATAFFPDLDALAQQVGGNTPMYAALDTLRDSVATDPSVAPGQGKAVVLFTDGIDTDCGNAAACLARRSQSVTGALAQGVRVFTIGLSRQIDVDALADLSNRTGGAFLYAESAEQLLPLYGTVGRLLSLSLPTYRLRWTVQADAPGAFASGRALLGRIEVRHGSGTFEVPFIVGIP
ncbi:carboxypeptidase regulatory-like domain-containing protein [Azohydromonas sediminis]|uniref:carboxypeptidase regulatory-like domain-containing protein n=1 Tax=Azohydromonas sediminis TaxID=2259674 RepID=UPI000E64DFEA|nr:carboxypeptidase regulatory-like domain-containing protein [Azohydromonas sediminis]